MIKVPLLEQAITIIRQKLPDTVGIYLFGSTGSIYAQPQSDLDIAVLPASKISPLVRWEVEQTLATKLNKEVDLIDLMRASTVLQFQIISTGKRIFSKNPLTCDLFETMVYSAYFYFNDERRSILEDIKKRGTIYNG